MAPKKKGKSKKPKEPKVNDEQLQEVDKAFYELEIKDLNMKLERLRNDNAEILERNEQLEADYTKLDEDRAEIIAYLKHELDTRTVENEELQERILQMDGQKSDEIQVYIDKMLELVGEYRLMQEELSAEIKLYVGKLNSLEEYRQQRAELMEKYEQQEKQMEEQERTHQLTIYELERKFVLGKDKLKKEMDAKLLKLSNDFQDANDLRIAATTQRVLRENKAINNELERMIETQKRLEMENRELKLTKKSVVNKMDIVEKERDTALRKYKTQMNLYKRLELDYGHLDAALNKEKRELAALKNVQKIVNEQNGEIEKLHGHIRLLEQRVHAIKCEKYEYETLSENCQYEISRLKDIIFDAAMSIKESIRSDEAKEDADRDQMLANMMIILERAQTEGPARGPSLETVTSAYEIGDLGFVPRIQRSKKYERFSKGVAVQVQLDSPSFGRKDSLKVEGQKDSFKIEGQKDLLKIEGQKVSIEDVFKDRSLDTSESEVLSKVSSQSKEESCDASEKFSDGHVSGEDARHVGSSGSNGSAWESKSSRESDVKEEDEEESHEVGDEEYMEDSGESQ